MAPIQNQSLQITFPAPSPLSNPSIQRSKMCKFACLSHWAVRVPEFKGLLIANAFQLLSEHRDCPLPSKGKERGFFVFLVGDFRLENSGDANHLRKTDLLRPKKFSHKVQRNPGRTGMSKTNLAEKVELKEGCSDLKKKQKKNPGLLNGE